MECHSDDSGPAAPDGMDHASDDSGPAAPDGLDHASDEDMGQLHLHGQHGVGEPGHEEDEPFDDASSQFSHDSADVGGLHVATSHMYGVLVTPLPGAYAERCQVPHPRPSRGCDG